MRPVDAAAQWGIEVIGSLWVLKEAKQHGMILAVRPIIEELLAIGYWLHPERVIRPFLQAMGQGGRHLCPGSSGQGGAVCRALGS